MTEEESRTSITANLRTGSMCEHITKWAIHIDIYEIEPKVVFQEYVV